MEEPSYDAFVARLNQAKAIADEKAQTTSYDDVFSGAVFSIAVKKNALLLSKQHDRVSEARLVGSTWQDACFNAKGSGLDILDWESPRLAPPSDSPASTSRAASHGSAAPTATAGGGGGGRGSYQQQRSVAQTQLDSPSRRASANAYSAASGAGRNASGRISAVLGASSSIGGRGGAGGGGGGGGSGSSSRASGMGLEAAAAAATAATAATAGGMSDDDDDELLPTRCGDSVTWQQGPRAGGVGAMGGGGQLRSAAPSRLVVELPAGDEPAAAPDVGSPGMASRADEAIRAFARTAYEPGEVRHSLFLHPGGADPQPRHSHDPDRAGPGPGDGAVAGSGGLAGLAPVPRAVPRHVAAAAVALSPTGRQRPASPGLGMGFGASEASAAALRSSWQGPLPAAAASPGGSGGGGGGAYPLPPSIGDDGPGPRRPASRGRLLTRSTSGLGFVAAAGSPSAAIAGATGGGGGGGGWPGSPVSLQPHGEGGGRPLMTPPPAFSPGGARRSLPPTHLTVKVGCGVGGAGNEARSPDAHAPPPCIFSPSSPSGAAGAAAVGGGGGASWGNSSYTAPHPPSLLQPPHGSPHPHHRAPGARALAAVPHPHPHPHPQQQQHLPGAAAGEMMPMHRVSGAGAASLPSPGAATSLPSPGARNARGGSLNGPAVGGGGGGMRVSASGEGSIGGGLIRGYAQGSGGGALDYRMLDSVPRIGLDGPRVRGASKDVAAAAAAASATAAARASAAGMGGATAAADSHADIRRTLLAAPPGLAAQRAGFGGSRPGTPSLTPPSGAAEAGATNASPGRFERAKRASANGGVGSMIVTREQVDKYLTGATPPSGVFASISGGGGGGGGGGGAGAVSSPVGGSGVKALVLGMRGCLTEDPASVASPKPRLSAAGAVGGGGMGGAGGGGGAGAGAQDSPRRARPEAGGW
ncbi:hypothetical protein CHLRE_12g500000v5 [Chlamydomonas reinhardtii]|uniref:Uncharacterized protein n=1 Tax=Chlamydomonas reinhardtii TaxID=3055 RepID=A0A2K3D3C2_CHLRE|nr:uncharacterized protein CHLRE_12g500000v5 [Chlamydomonas reinhardtii]PNW75017.1 hypothetical protein CHLRE_12g500000v5 [Chlamydomonas reinhardtii]